MTDILQLDYLVFDYIHNQWTNGFFDAVLPYWRNKYVWLPLYFFIMALLAFNYSKRGLKVIAVVLLTVALADIASSSIIKPLIKRTRPCNIEAVNWNVESLVPCGSGYSFTSSHATNHFALSIILILVLNFKRKIWRYMLLFWAASIAYAQVYVGVHFPMDILAGSILGSLIAISVYLLVTRIFDPEIYLPV
jgi:undecaprenyl-diphosphatase